MKQTYLFLALLLSVSLHGQNIQFDFPALSGKALSLSLKNGIQRDTIFTSKLDAQGKANAVIPAAFKGYMGMASLMVEDALAIDFIVNNENLNIGIAQEPTQGNNIVFKNSPENTALQTNFVGQAIRQQKLQSLSGLQPLYAPTDQMSGYIQTELESLVAQQIDFEKELKTSPLYAFKFIGYYNFAKREVASVLSADSLQNAQVRAFVRDSLDINGLYSSGLWFDTLNGLLALYAAESPYHNEYINDMSRLLGRCQSDKVYMTLAENLFSICESSGWNDLEEQLAYFLINDGRLKNPQGKLKLLITLFKLSTGSVAPPLSQHKVFKGTNLLVFHESGCGNCTVQMQQLANRYKSLQEKGVNVISVSADVHKATFDASAAAYPWTDKYCDLTGISGTNFKDYGVLGTPTFFLIKEGKIAGRYAQLSQVKF